VCFNRNDVFVGRTYLAAIDHNAHVFRKAAVTASGKPKHNKVYSKRSKNWRIEVVKEPKTYDFWPTIACRILKKRVDDEESILRKVEIPKEHSKNIAQSINPYPRQVILLNSQGLLLELLHSHIQQQMHRMRKQHN
jgi:hypothetical protein